MRLKKLFTALMAAAMASVLFVMPVSAHGHHRSAQTADTSCPVCTVDGCEETGRHTHDGKDYCGYDHADGYCDHSCETSSRNTRHGRHRHCH